MTRRGRVVRAGTLISAVLLAAVFAPDSWSGHVFFAFLLAVTVAATVLGAVLAAAVDLVRPRRSELERVWNR